jgi:uncharacterized RDD family membrane protein YckC
MTNSFDTLNIDTPENVTFDYSVAGIGSRFLAALVDTIVIALLQAIVIGTLLWLSMQFEDPSVATQSAAETNAGDAAFYWTVGILTLISFIFYWGYYIFFEILWNGQSPGKRMVGLRVIRVDGTPVAAPEIVIRNLVRVIDLMPAAYGLGVVTMFVSQNSRRLGDLAAGTVVVHEKKTKFLHEIASDRQRNLGRVLSLRALPETFPIERLTLQDIHVLEEYLTRRARLENKQRLARHILDSLLERLGEAREAHSTSDPDDTIAAIYNAWKERYSKSD